MKVFLVLLHLGLSVTSMSAFSADAQFSLSSMGLSNPLGMSFKEPEKKPYSLKREVSPVTSSGCAERPQEEVVKLDHMANEYKNISKMLTCDKKRMFFLARFSYDSCKDALDCRKNVADMNSGVKGADTVMNEIVARDYAKNILAQTSAKMENLEILKSFAQKKYDSKLGSNCASRFIPSKTDGLCNLNLLDEVYASHQSYCSSGSDCHNTNQGNVKSFKNYLEKEKTAKLARIIDYNQYRADEKIKDVIEQDADYLNKLSNFMTTDASFKQASLDERLKAFIKKVNGDYKDPVLAFEFESESMNSEKLKNSPKFKDLVALISRKDLNKEAFTKSFDDFRKARAQAVLNQGLACQQTPTLGKICSDITALEQGKKIAPMDPMQATNLSSASVKNPENLTKLRNFFGNNFSSDDFDVLVEARRCLSFGYINEDYSRMKDAPKKPIAEVWNSNMSRRPSSEENAPTVVANTPVREIARSSSSASESYSGTTDSSNEESGASQKIGSLGQLGSGSTGAIAAPKTFGNSVDGYPKSTFGPGNFETTASEEFTRSQEEQKKKNEALNSASNSENRDANSEQLRDLNNRLAASEAKVAKMETEKFEKEESEKALAQQKRIDEENKVIQELKNQIKDLKVQASTREVPQAAAAPMVENRRNQYENAPSSNFYNPAPAPVREYIVRNAPESYEPSRAPASSMNSAGKGSASAVTLTSSGSGDSVKKSGNAGSITNVDGLSAEASLGQISQKIMEMKGKSFFIEEGGMIKEIFPILEADGTVALDEKGNPRFEKITKGRATDKKFAQLKDGRSPASSPAEVKKADEEKLKLPKPVKYQDLMKTLQNGVGGQ